MTIFEGKRMFTRCFFWWQDANSFDVGLGFQHVSVMNYMKSCGKTRFKKTRDGILTSINPESTNIKFQWRCFGTEKTAPHGTKIWRPAEANLLGVHGQLVHLWRLSDIAETM